MKWFNYHEAAVRELAVDFTEQDSSVFERTFYSHGPDAILTIPPGKRLRVRIFYDDDPNADLLQQAFDNGREVEKRTAGYGELLY